MLLTTLIDLSGTLGWIAMLAPFAVLGVALIWALFDREPRAGETRPEADVRAAEPAMEEAQAGHAALRQPPRPTVVPPTTSPPVAAAPPPPPVAAPSDTWPSAPPAPPPRRPVPPAAPSPPPGQIPVATPAPELAPAAPVRPAARAPTDSATSDSVARIEREIRAAVAQTDEAGVARLSLELARLLPQGREQGHDVEGYLRRCIMIAMRLGDTRTHAAARLELGDRVGARGDMITACEHWQIARQIFWDGNEAGGLAEADRRMIANGCPTDWVLNDF